MRSLEFRVINGIRRLHRVMGRMQAGLWGSIVPAFWSFLLAARARGLGTAYTTLHLEYEQEVAEILAVPYDEYTQAGLTPIAYYMGEEFAPAARVPVEIGRTTSWASWRLAARAGSRFT